MLIASPGRRGRAIPIAAFAVGLVLGGSTSATVLWMVSGISEPIGNSARLVVLATVMGISFLRDARAISFDLPENRRQIPITVLRKGRLRGPGQFGFEMGTGVRTFITATTVYSVAAALLLLRPSFMEAFLTGVGFGIGRALMLLLRYVSGDGEAWDSSMQRLSLRLPVISTGFAAVAMTHIALPLFA